MGEILQVYILVERGIILLDGSNCIVKDTYMWDLHVPTSGLPSRVNVYNLYANNRVEIIAM